MNVSRLVGQPQQEASTPKHAPGSGSTFRNNHLRNDVDDQVDLISVHESKALENCKLLLQRRMQQCLERSQKSRLSRQSDVQTSATHVASLNHSREAINNRYMSDKVAALALGQQQTQTARIQPDRPCIRRRPKYNRTQRVSIDL